MKACSIQLDKLLDMALLLMCRNRSHQGICSSEPDSKYIRPHNHPHCSWHLRLTTDQGHRPLRTHQQSFEDRNIHHSTPVMCPGYPLQQECSSQQLSPVETLCRLDRTVQLDRLPRTTGLPHCVYSRQRGLALRLPPGSKSPWSRDSSLHCHRRNLARRVSRWYLPQETSS